MVKWYHKSLPSLRCGFDSRYPLQNIPIFSSLIQAYNRYSAYFESSLGRGLIGDIKVTLKFKTTGRGLRTKSQTCGKSEVQPSFFLRFQRQWRHRLRVCCAPFEDQAWAICCLILARGYRGPGLMCSCTCVFCGCWLRFSQPNLTSA